VAFGPAGRTILSGSSDQQLILWDTTSGEAIRHFSGHSGRVNGVAFSPHGDIAVSGSEDGTVILWGIQKGSVIWRIKLSDAILSVAFSPDGSRLASGSRDDQLCEWKLETGEQISCIKPAASYGVTSLTFSPDNRTVLVGAGGFGPGIFTFDLDTGGLIHQLAGHMGGNTKVAYSSDGQLAVTGSADNSLILWDAKKGTEIQRFIGHSDDITGVAFSPNNRTIISSSADESLRLWDIVGGAGLQYFRGYDNVAISPDGRMLASRSDDDLHLVLINSESGKVARFFEEQSTWIMSLKFGPDGRTVFLGLADGSIHLLDIESGQIIRNYLGHPNRVNSLAISRDGRYALSGSYGPPGWRGGEALDNLLILWNVKTGEIVHRLIGHTGVVRSVAISSDGQRAISGSDDATVRLWNIETGQEIRRFEGGNAVASIAFGPEERTFLTASSDRTVRLWDIETGEEIRRFTGHTFSVNSIALSPDGQTMLSGSDDRSVRLWDIKTGLEMAHFSGHPEGVWGVAFMPGGGTALSYSADGTIILWQIYPTQNLVRWVCANRYVGDLTCAERQQYGVKPFCEDGPISTSPICPSYSAVTPPAN
jgi:WD40 repeat protein